MLCKCSVKVSFFLWLLFLLRKMSQTQHFTYHSQLNYLHTKNKTLLHLTWLSPLMPENIKDVNNPEWQVVERLLMNVFGRGFCDLHLYIAIIDVLGIRIMKTVRCCLLWLCWTFCSVPWWWKNSDQTSHKETQARKWQSNTQISCYLNSSCYLLCTCNLFHYFEGRRFI